MIFSFRAFLLLMGLFAGTSGALHAQGQVQNAESISALARISLWLAKNDPGAKADEARRSSNGFMVFHILKTKPITPGDTVKAISIWRENYFNEIGDWLESRIRMSETDCEIIGADLCDAVSMAEEGYQRKYATPTSGTMVIILTPKYSWLELPIPNGFALFDLWGNFLEERKF
jgi:hypothetical protein